MEKKKGRTENLISFRDRSPEEMAAILKKAGEARAKKNKARKTLRECFSILRDEKIKDDEIEAKLKEMGMEDEELTLGMAMALRCIESVLNGNPQMARLVFEMLGESKTEIDINGSMPVVIHDDVRE
jgi:hypothetical protein